MPTGPLRTPAALVPAALVVVDKSERQRLSPPGLRTFFRIMERWKVSDETGRALLGVSARSYRQWRDHPERTLSCDKLIRISYVLGIYGALQMPLPQEAADGWPSRSNAAPLFGGGSAIDYMAEGGVAALQQVRRYPNAQLG